MSGFSSAYEELQNMFEKSMMNKLFTPDIIYCLNLALIQLSIINPGCNLYSNQFII